MTAIKLDENLGRHLLSIAREAGYDAESVGTQRLNGTSDLALFEHCRAEQRALITLDLDFANPFRFQPGGTAGTIVLRTRRPSLLEITSLFEEALARLHSDPVNECIWIVEPGRVRIYRSSNVDEEADS